MAFQPFFKKFESLAETETRAFIIPKGHKLLPPGEYGLLEFYCDNPNCDCRRVIFWISRSDHPDRILATINFGWETPEFYRRWIGGGEGIDEMVGVSLEPLGPQSKHSESLLALCRHALQEEDYVERIKRHYKIFRKSLKADEISTERVGDPGNLIRFCLTVKEWDLLIGNTFIEKDLIERVEIDGNKRYIDWSTDDIDCVIGYISEAANHVENKTVEKRLGKLLDKIEKIISGNPGECVSQMKNNKPRNTPDWVKEDTKVRSTPYTEEELDELTEGTIRSIEDLDVWKDLVAMVGLEDATKTIRMALQEQ